MPFFMCVLYGDGAAHAARLKRGLLKLGPDFLARLCWRCHGTATRDFSPCDICGKGTWNGLGLLTGNEPSPASVVNQVLVAADNG